MGQIVTTQPGGAGSFTGSGTASPGEMMYFAYVGATTTFAWSLQSRPGGSAAAISRRGATGMLAPDLNGVYTVRFTDSSSVTTDVTITVAQEATYTDLGSYPVRWTLASRDASGAYVRVVPEEAASSPLMFTHGSYANPYGGTTRLNQVWNLGWNIKNGGTTEKAAEGGVGISCESYFYQDVATLNSEFHLFYLNPAGTQFRPISWSFNQLNDHIGVELRHDSIRFATPTNRTIAYMFDGYMQFGEPGFTVGIRIGTNDTAAIIQLNAAQNGYVELLRVHSNDGVSVAPGGKAGFLGATPIARPSVTGSRGANAALASLLTQLATLGLITDNSS
jgi:hypothetical protein